MNDLFNLLGGNTPLQNTPFGNAMQFMNQFNQFKNSFSGNAQQQIQNMLNSGQLSQDKYNQAVQLASQIRGMFR